MLLTVSSLKTAESLSIFLFVVIKEPFAIICSIYLDNYFPNLNPGIYNMLTSM